MAEKHKKHSEHKEVHHKKKVKKIVVWQWFSAILAVLLIASIFTGGFKGTTTKKLSAKVAGEKAANYINTNLLQPGMEAKIRSVSEKSGLYNMKMVIDGREYDSYITLDGGLLFPSSFDLNQKIEIPDTTAPEPQDIQKTDKPKVDLFVMSHCPYGTQAEKGILPVVKLLGNKIDFNLRFVYYAMHGKTEVDEQTSQYCIQKEQNDKFADYLLCFLEEGKSGGCLTETKIDKEKLNKCVDTADKEFKITEQFSDKSTWLNGRYPLFDINKELNVEYGIGGSPTLVINDQTVSSGRDSASLLKTICSSFNEEPAECEKELSSASPSPGFGFSESTTANIEATCG